MPRKINRLLIANRGEIAQRIIQSARELSLETHAIYTPDDAPHARLAHHAILLGDPSAYTDTAALVRLCAERGIDAIHPGYGFLSESAEFAELAARAGVLVVGPGPEILRATGDKVAARRLAQRCGVPVLPALESPARSVEDARRFAAEAGYPVMIKAVDGGGGRGIRLAESEGGMDAAFRRAVEESPTRRVFVERAAVRGFKHVEVQVVGDGRGRAVHLFERECSVQRRWQKVVEVAPCVRVERRFIRKIVDAALRIATEIKYVSLGTFEFLANPQTEEFYFLEVNPRLQVEHTITESLCDVDLVRIQLLIAQGATLEEAGLSKVPLNPETPPAKYVCQFRVTAEDVSKEWTLSIGKITSVTLPCGNGVRVDSALAPGQVIGSSFDSLLAKIIVSAPSWEILLQKARRCLAETSIEGVKTNLAVLRGIVEHPEFGSQHCDTRWLERKQDELMRLGKAPELAKIESSNISTSQVPSNAGFGVPILRKGDAWAIHLDPVSGPSPGLHHLSIDRILENNFPSALRASISLSNQSGATRTFNMRLSSTSASASAVTSARRRGDPRDPRHVVVPFPGKLVEVCVDVGDVLAAEDVVCVVQQMKMEIEIRARAAGRVAWVTDAEDGEDVDEGILAAVLDPLEGGAKL